MPPFGTVARKPSYISEGLSPLATPNYRAKIAVKSYAIFALTKYYKILCNSPPGIRWRLFLIMSKFPCSFRKFRIDIFTETWYNENVATG